MTAFPVNRAGGTTHTCRSGREILLEPLLSSNDGDTLALLVLKEVGRFVGVNRPSNAL
ncbi:hypothetical protein J2S98_004552 [Arthrobacter oryzae]|nr:hypothetical protein [Arthrobacter oryzae]